MAMSTRAKWMAQCISDIFGIGEYDAHVSTRDQSYALCLHFKSAGLSARFQINIINNRSLGTL